MYCVTCVNHIDTINIEEFTATNGRQMQKGICSVCGNVKTRLIKSGTGLFNTLVSKLPFELHPSGHNCTGPGRKLDKRLNPDGMPKDWSKPTTRVDEAAHHHDLCYAKHGDTKTGKEVCDKPMQQDLSNIYNPSLQEKSRGVS